MIIGTILLAGFVVHALRKRSDPLLDLRLFRVRSYAASATLMFLFGISIYGPMLLLPLYYPLVRGYSPLDAGLMLAPKASAQCSP